MRLVALSAAAVTILIAGMPSRLKAQEVEVAGFRAVVTAPTRPEEPRREPLWGTATTSVRTIKGLAFQESSSGTTFTYDSSTQRYRTSGDPWFDAPLPDLPGGAELVGLELEGCDTNAAAHVAVFLFRYGSPAGPIAVVGNVSTGDAETPGCAFFGSDANLTPGEFVDNRNDTYWVRAELTGTSTTTLGAVRVFYKLRVSPAPAVATFSDVPTSHLYFRAIEALAASGITGGCGVGIFCPNGTVTRGEMAAFLARALGLHFPN